jgi:hypothetical protein
MSNLGIVTSLAVWESDGRALGASDQKVRNSSDEQRT